ncbi:MAG TPA: carboxypeptidase regulatory-like domain-containing protein, partial [Saprospiraceae bacterium]|nr:carboxypeptidase regulatory-like domain-containing protein [Saprospiraceae bacterium]
MKKILVIISLFLIQISYAQLTAAQYTIKNIKANTKYSDYGTSYFGPNRIIFASSKLDGKKLKSKFKKADDDLPRYDLFKGFLNYKGEINYVKKLLNNFVTKYNESNVSFTPDLRHVYFTQNNIKKGKYIEDDSQWVNLKIYRASVKTNGEWGDIVSLPFNNDKYSCAHPSVSEDGRVLFFSSDMPGSYGASDIYWVTINKNGTYGEPQNLGAHVNSAARENFPYVEGNILYFSSDRPTSSGGLDVYMVALDDQDAEPVNLGAPINSEYDDFCFVIDRQHKKGFFSSNRPDGKGEDDIYSFVQETEMQECKQVINGEIRDKETNKIIPGAVVTMYSHNNIILSTYPTKSDGKFSFDLACRGNYRVEANQV